MGSFRQKLILSLLGLLGLNFKGLEAAIKAYQEQPSEKEITQEDRAIDILALTLGHNDGNLPSYFLLAQAAIMDYRIGKRYSDSESKVG